MRASIVVQEQRAIESLALHCANGLTATVAQAQAWITNHDELHRRYKEKWSTWDAACQDVYKMSRQAIHKRLLKISEDSSSTTVDEVTDSEHKETLETVNNLPDPTKEPEPPKEPEPEKPAVHSADETKQPEPPKPRTPKENGVPKYQLPVWNQLETTFGRSLNVADELNRKCPCPVKHALFIHQTKMAMETLNQWRESVK